MIGRELIIPGSLLVADFLDIETTIFVQYTPYGAIVAIKQASNRK